MKYMKTLASLAITAIAAAVVRPTSGAAQGAFAPFADTIALLTTGSNRSDCCVQAINKGAVFTEQLVANNFISNRQFSLA